MTIKMCPKVILTIILLQSTSIAIYNTAAQSIFQKSDSTSSNLRGSLIKLRWAEQEVKEIIKITHGNSYIRQQATEQRFKQEAGKANIIHLATHAITDDENPMYSKLVFALDTSAGEDGFLNTYELYNMQLNADLVVLSACNTGYGKLYRGEGVMSLARGFMYAGCRRIMMSLWSVDDQSSAKIMTLFYQNLAGGLTINEALRHAKLTYLRTADKVKSNPFYWAGFVSIGETTPLLLERGSNKKYIFSLLIFLTLILAFFLKKRIFPKLNGVSSLIYFITLFSVLFFHLQQTYSQNKNEENKPDSTLADDYFAKAESLYEEAHYDSSNFYFEKASSLYQNKDNWLEYIKCLNRLANNYIDEAEYALAMTYLEKALRIGQNKLSEQHLEIAQTHHNMGRIYTAKGDYDKALDVFNKSLHSRYKMLGGNHPQVAQTYNRIGVIYDYKGDYERALDFLYKSLTITKEALGETHPDIATTYNNIAIIFRLRGFYDKALVYQKKALSIRLATVGKDHPLTAVNYFNMAIILINKGEYDKAQKYLEKDLYINSKTYGQNHLYIAENYSYMASLYKLKGNYKKTLEFLETALSIYLELVGETHRYVANNYHDTGLLFDKTHKYEKSKEFLNRALDIRLEIFGKHHFRVAESYYDRGKIFFEQNDCQKALSYYQKSIISLIPDFNDTNIYRNPNSKHVISEPILLLALESKAEAFEKYYWESNNLNDLELSIATYQLALELIVKMRTGYSAESSKLSFTESAYNIYEKAIKAAFKAHEITGEDKYKEIAFLFAEKSKNGILLEGLSDSKTKHFVGIPDTLLHFERQLKIEQAFYNKELSKEFEKGVDIDSSKISLLQDKSFTLQQAYDNLISKFETDYPEYYNLKYQTQTISIKQLQEKILTENDAIVEYFLGDSTIFIFTIDRQKFNVFSIDKYQPIEEQVNSLRANLNNHDYQGYTNNAFKLYQALIKPIERLIKNKNLIIIPDGILCHLPFDVLLAQKAKDNNDDYRKLNYLIKDFQISYSYSASLLIENINNDRIESPVKVMAFAPVVFN